MSATQAIVTHTVISESPEAGRWLGQSVLDKLGGSRPDVLIVFASPNHDFTALLAALQQTCQPALLLGCSSAGEFSGCTSLEGSVSVMALLSADIRFNAAIATGLREDRDAAMRRILPVFTAHAHPEFPYRSALILTDALAGDADEMIHEITVETHGMYQLFGGGAADDGKFHQTHVFLGDEVHSDALVILEILSKKPIGLGVKHGWEPCGEALRVTASEGSRLISLNAITAVDVIERHALATGQNFDRADPLPFFLHNVIGIDTGDGYKLRVPLMLHPDGAISCAAEVPVGATVHLMIASVASATEAARTASQAAIAGLKGNEHAGSLVFDCMATRARLGRQFGEELQAVSTILGSENFAGCNTYGQIARADGQFSGFHNCTAIVCAFPR